MITNGIIFKNFQVKKKFKQVSKDLNLILKKKKSSYSILKCQLQEQF